MTKIAIIITTFLRDNLLYETVQSIPKDKHCILIGDQGNHSKEKDTYFKMRRYKDVVYLTLPFDCGLSASRNFLVKKAQELDCKYCLISADSIQFIKDYDFQPIIDFLEEDPRRGTVGFSLKDRIPWEVDIELMEGKHFLLNAPTREKINYKGIDFQPVDMHRNFFLAKTEALLHTPWDEDLKLCEHEDHAWRWKNNYKYFPEFGRDIYQRFYTDFIEVKYVDNKPIEYKCYDEKTEILTDQGWKLFKDLNKTEKVATLNLQKNIVEYHSPIKYYTYNYNGKLYYIDTNRINLKITPNHSLVLKSRYNKVHFDNVDKFASSCRGKKFIKNFPYNNIKNTKYFILPEIRILRGNRWNKNKKEQIISNKKVLMNLWVEFLGWFISEGNLNERVVAGYYIIKISQELKSNKKNRLEIERMLLKLNFKYWKDNHGFYIRNRQVFRYLKQFGKAKDKFIPRSILNRLSKNQLKILFYTLIKGDGHITKQGYIRYATVSKQLADDMFELGLKVGFMSNLQVIKPRKPKIFGKICNCQQTYILSFATLPITVLSKKVRFLKLIIVGKFMI